MHRLQQTVREFQDEHDMRLSAELAALDLGTEVGELMKELLLASDYGTQPSRPRENLTAELGDVCYTLLSVALAVDIDLEQALASRLESFRCRFAGRRNNLRSDRSEP